MQKFDVIVIGLGGVGSATAMQLARRGKTVCGIEQFPLNHDQGSSHGQSRVIRQAYFEHSDYVPLLKRAYALWRELEKSSVRQLYLQTGLLEIGPPDGVVIPGVLKSANEHGLRVDQIERDDCARRFPQFCLPAEMVSVFENDAGLLLVEDCVRAHLEAARAAGAQLHENEAVIDWNSNRHSVTVKTSRETYAAESLVISAGSWSRQILVDMRFELRVLRKHMHWYEMDNTAYNFDRGAGQGSPTFFYETPSGYFYGFPVIDSAGLKVCEHSGGELVRDPANVDRSQCMMDRQRIDAFLESYLSACEGRHRDHAVCLYTMSHDENFILDFHPEFPNVTFACGLSGHGFKFTPVIGDLLAEMVVNRFRQAEAEFLAIRQRSDEPDCQL